MPAVPPSRKQAVASASSGTVLSRYWWIGAIAVFGAGVLVGRLSGGDGQVHMFSGDDRSSALQQEQLARFQAEDRANRAEETLVRLEKEERERLKTERLAMEEKSSHPVQEPAGKEERDLFEDPSVVGRPAGDFIDSTVAVASSPAGSGGLGSGDAREWRSKYRYAAIKYNRLVGNYDRLQKKYMELTGADGGKNGIVTGNMFYRVLRRSTKEELNRVNKELNGGVSTRRVRDVRSHIEALEEREKWLRNKAGELGIE